MPQTSAVVHDPVETPAAVVGGDFRTAAKRATQVADENALRLLQSWCNYDSVRMSYASGEGKVSEEPRCLALRDYLKKGTEHGR